MKTLRNILIGLMILISARLSAEPIGDIISYQGKLTNADGTPVANGTQSVTFKIYENGSSVFTQTSSVATVGGVFSVFLSVAGQVNFDPAKQYEMGVTFGGTETKHSIGSVPVAKIAEGNVKKSGDTMTGDLSMNNHGIYGVYSISTGAVDGHADVFGGNLNLRSSPEGGETFIELGANHSGRTVHVGWGGTVHLDVTGNVSIGGQITTSAVGNAAIQDGAVTQAKAPFALAGPAANCRIETGRWSGVPTPYGGSLPNTATVRIDFASPFTNLPVVVATPLFVYSPNVTVTSNLASTTGVTVNLTRPDGWPANQEIQLYWIAVGK